MFFFFICWNITGSVNLCRHPTLKLFSPFLSRCTPFSVSASPRSPASYFSRQELISPTSSFPSIPLAYIIHHPSPFAPHHLSPCSPSPYPPPPSPLHPRNSRARITRREPNTQYIREPSRGAKRQRTYFFRRNYSD